MRHAAVDHLRSVLHTDVVRGGFVPRMVRDQAGPRGAVVGSALVERGAQHADGDHLLRKILKYKSAGCHCSYYLDSNYEYIHFNAE